MEKRLLITFVLSLAIVLAFQLLRTRFAPPPPPPAPPPSSAEAPSRPPPGPAAPTAGEHKPGVPPAAVAPGPRAPEERTVVERPGYYRAVFSSWGAAPAVFTLENPQYKMTVGGRAVPIEMIDPASQLPYLTWFQSAGAEGERSDFDVSPEAAWTLARHSDEELVYTLDAGPVRLEKKWTFARTGYQIGLELSVENRGDRPLAHHLLVAVHGYQDPNIKPGGFMSFGRRVNLRDAECDVAGKVRRVARSGGGGCGGGGDEKPTWSAPIAEAGDLRWVAIGEQYFTLAFALGPGAEGGSCHLEGEPGGRLTARAVYPQQTLSPGARETFSMAAFAGPKLLHALDDVHVAGRDVKLGDAVDYTLAFIARPLQWVLTQIHRVVRNWGLAIIVITILLKLVLLYPTQQSMKSMKEMAKLKPKIDAIKARYPNDSMRQNQETMALYKQHHVNPLGSCLPMALQLPIYFAFYSMLSNAVDLYRASFVGPMDDMTAPWWPLAVVTGGLMYLQQKFSPSAADPQQQRMMAMMPVLFTVMTLFLPSGLTLYIFTNTLLTMLHQWWMNRQDPDKPRAGGRSLKPARA